MRLTNSWSEVTFSLFIQTRNKFILASLNWEFQTPSFWWYNPCNPEEAFTTPDQKDGLLGHNSHNTPFLETQTDTPVAPPPIRARLRAICCTWSQGSVLLQPCHRRLKMGKAEKCFGDHLIHLLYLTKKVWGSERKWNCPQGKELVYCSSKKQSRVSRGPV